MSPQTANPSGDVRLPGPRAPKTERSPEAQRVVDDRWSFVQAVCVATGLDTIARGDQAKHFAEVTGMTAAAIRFLLYPTEAKGLTPDQIESMKAKLKSDAGIDELNWDRWQKSAFPEGSFPVKPKKEKPKTPKEPKSAAPATAPSRGKRSREDDDDLGAAARFPVACEKTFLVSVSEAQTVLDVSRVATPNHRLVAYLPPGYSHELFQTKDGRTYIVMEKDED